MDLKTIILYESLINTKYILKAKKLYSFYIHKY